MQKASFQVAVAVSWSAESLAQCCIRYAGTSCDGKGNIVTITQLSGPSLNIQDCNVQHAKISGDCILRCWLSELAKIGLLYYSLYLLDQFNIWRQASATKYFKYISKRGICSSLFRTEFYSSTGMPTSMSRSWGTFMEVAHAWKLLCITAYTLSRRNLQKQYGSLPRWKICMIQGSISFEILSCSWFSMMSVF